MTKNDILAYVTETPTNTNRAVLSHMLDSFESGDNKQEIELSATENKVYTPDEGKVYKKVTVNVPAPASDFSTAEVTLQITSAQTDAMIIIPSVITSPMDAISNNLYNPTTAGTQQVITVPLYKGSLIINGMWDSEVTVTTSGNVQVMDRSFLITGDCAITIA